MKIQLIVLISILANFAKGQVSFNDSLPIAVQGKVNHFEMLSPVFPLLVADGGIYIPSARTWYYKPADTAVRVRTFAVSWYDSSVYMLLDYQANYYLVNLRHEKGVEVQKSLLKLRKGYSYEIFPTAPGRYFLSRTDSMSTIFNCKDTNMTKLYTTAFPIKGLTPVDSSMFSYCWGKKVYLFDKGRVKLLFNSDWPIYSMAFSDRNMMYISTARGIFSVDRQLNARLVNGTVRDGMLRILDDRLFVLSNEGRKIYTVNL